MPKSKNSSRIKTKAHFSQKKSRMKHDQSYENKETLKPLYYSVVQRIFTQEILQNKRSFVNNPKVMYFFGFIFHALKKGIIKSSLSDFMLHADKIFIKSKISEIQEVIEQYIKLQEENKQKKISTNTIEIIEVGNNNHKQFKHSINTPKQIGKESIKYTAIQKQNQNRRVHFLSQKQYQQSHFSRIGRFSNFSTKISQYPNKNSRLILKQCRQQPNKIKGEHFEQNNPQTKIQFSRVNRKYLTARSIGKISSVDNHFDDDKITQLNNRLQQQLKLNKQYLQKSRTTRQHCQ